MLAAASGLEERVIVDLVAILATAAVVALVMQRLRLAVIPAYIIAGAIVGPHAVGLVPAPDSLGAISHLAIILLLFGIGLELHVSALRHRFVQISLAGLGACLGCVVAGWPIGMAFGLSTPAALQLAMALSLSSTAVVLRLLALRREMHQTSGRMALATLVIQDMLVLVMLAAIPLIAQWAGQEPAGPLFLQDESNAELSWPRYALDGLLRLLGIGGAAVAARLVLPLVFRESLRGRSLEIMMVVGVATALAAAELAQALGFSLEMGAFLGGFILAGTQFRHQLSAQIGPLRDVFIAVFFTTVGMKLDPVTLASHWWIVLLGVVVLLVVKSGVISAVAWTFGATAGLAVTVGLVLSQAGEFSLILLDAATKEGIVTEAQTSVTIAVVVISLVLTPGLIAVGKLLGTRLNKLGPAPWIGSAVLHDVKDGPPDHAEPAGYVILAGYGPTGRLIAEQLDEVGMPYTVIELNPDTVKQQRQAGKAFVLGDASNPEVLASVGIERADVLILTIPDEEAVMRACAVARRLAPSIFIAARTGLVSRGKLAEEIGASHVTVDEMATAEAMLRVVMQRVNLAMGRSPEVPAESVD